MTSFDLYRRDLAGVRPLAADHERALARRYREGDREAGAALVAACLPFVISLAREHRRWGVPLEDLVQQGNLGLLHAAKRFDPDRDTRLVTFAAQWIRGEMRAYALKGQRIVKLGSTHTERTALRVHRGGRAKSAEELAAKSGMPLERATRLFTLLAQRDASLDASIEGGPPAVERHPTELATPEDEIAAREERRRLEIAVARAIDALDLRARRIVEARMMADEPCTLEDLGREMGVSRERVRQLEARARTALAASLADLRGAA